MSFTLGGAVSPTGFYVERAADIAALKYLSSFQSCYIAQSRQSGKSSLRKHTTALLRERGFAVVEVDLTNTSRDSLTKLWERIETLIVTELARVGRTPRPWLVDGPESSERNFSAYVANDVVPLLDQGLVVFFDEVNVLGTRGDAAIIMAELRTLIERRVHCAVCLLGVCPPSDLVNEPGADPTPLMHAVVIEDFTRKEAAAFAPLLVGVRDPERVLDAAFAQTSGHPYMLQNILAMVVDAAAAPSNEPPRDDSDEVPAESLVAELVGRKFFHRAMPDPVLEIPQHTFGRALDQRAIDALNLYRAVIAGQQVQIEAEDRRPALEMLRLAGMVKLDGTTVVSRNPIFARRYDQDWVRDKLDLPMYEILATQWNLEDHHPDFLLRGRSLRAATDWLGARRGVVTRHVADFIQTSAATAFHERGAVTRLRYALLGSLLAIIAALGVAMSMHADAQRAEADAQRAEAEAAQESLKTKLAAEQAQKISMDRLLTSYQSQINDAAAKKQILETNLRDAEASLAMANADQDKAQKEYYRAKQSNASNLATVRANLESVNRRAELLGDAKRQLESDLRATQNREQTLGADLKAAQVKVDKLAKEANQSQALLNQEKQLSAGLASQIDALKLKTSDMTGQLNDIQNKYNECVARLAESSQKVLDANSKATSCLTKQAP
jgi:hypothetical protein